MSDVSFRVFDFLDQPGRQGIYLESGAGLGEISPLPGFSRETFEEALDEVVQNMHRSASVRWGFECLELTRAAAKEGLSLAHYLNPLAEDVASNALVMGPPDTWIEQILAAKKSSIHVFKVKLGRFDPTWEIEVLTTLRDVLDGGDRIRLDANRKWDLSLWLAASSEWRELPIEYVEEPLTDVEGLSEFHDHTGLFLGLDETFREWDLSRALRIPGVKALIIKPTLMGAVLPLMDRLKDVRDVDLVFSHSFESAIGRGILQEYAKAFGRGVVCGV